MPPVILPFQQTPRRLFRIDIRPTPGMLNRAVAVCDGLVILAVALAAQQWPTAAALTFVQTMLVGMTAGAAFVLTLRAAGVYRLETYRSLRAQAPGVLLGLIVAAAADRVLVWAFAPDLLDDNQWLMAWTAATLGGVLAGREAMAFLMRRVFTTGALQRRVVVIGTPGASRALIARMQAATTADEYRLVGVFDPAERLGSRRNCRGRTLEDFARVAQSQRIDLIIIARSWRDPAGVFDLAEKVQWVSADVAALLDNDDRLGRASQRMTIAGLPALKLCEHPLRGTEGVVKALQDYTVALLALLLAAPVMLVAALAVRMSGPGPVLFRQTRIGFNGRAFHIYKFRTMTVDPTDDGTHFKPKGDSRITRIGAFLRQTSLDELPQLFNVLAGDMSIVGPRPHVPNMSIGDGAYAETVRTYAGRCQIKPGITGWAQINGMRGGIDTLEKARRGVALDLHYIRNWSLRLDIEIMLKTLTRNMVGRNVF